MPVLFNSRLATGIFKFRQFQIGNANMDIRDIVIFSIKTRPVALVQSGAEIGGLAHQPPRHPLGDGVTKITAASCSRYYYFDSINSPGRRFISIRFWRY
jgi:hypothetical protein